MMKFFDDKNKVVYLNLHKEQLIRIASSGVEGCSTITYREHGNTNWQLVQGDVQTIHDMFHPKPMESLSMVDQMIDASELKRLKEQNKMLNSQYKILLEQSQDVVKELRETKELLAKANQKELNTSIELGKCRAELNNTKEHNAWMTKRVDKLNDQNEDFTRQINNANIELRDLREQRAGLIKEHDAKGRMLLKFVEERETLMKEKEELKTLHANQMSNIKALQERIKKLEGVEDFLTGKCITIINMQ